MDFKGAIWWEILEFLENFPKSLIEIRIRICVVSLEHNEVRIKNQTDVTQHGGKGAGQIVHQVAGQRILCG